MIGPELQQLRIQVVAQPPKTHQHATITLFRQLQLPGQAARLKPGAAGGEPNRQLGNSPVDRHRQGAAQQQVALAVGRQATVGPGAESGTHRPVDGLPAKAGQPDQRSPDPAGQGRRRWGHVCKHKQRHRLGGQPGLLSRQLGGQLSFQGR